MDREFINAALERIINKDQGTDDYRLATFALFHAMKASHREALLQLVNSGPISDGDIISKTARDDLIEWGLAVRVCVRGAQGFTAARNYGYDVLHGV